VYASPPIHLGAMLGLEASGPLSGRDRVRVIGIAACQGDGVSVASGGAEWGGGSRIAEQDGRVNHDVRSSSTNPRTIRLDPLGTDRHRQRHGVEN
jgi:hypothetical protein